MPTSFGPYRVLHQIGGGGLGPVFRSFHPERDRIVAIKSLRLDLTPEAMTRLADGLRALAARAFVHPHAVAVLDAGLEDVTPYVVMEYVTGESLDVTWRQRRSTTVTEVTAVIAEVADVLDAAHAAGLAHGNLHPRDILLTSRTHAARVTGIGLAAAIEAAGIAAAIRRPYTAPERLDGHPVSARTDVYSLAAIAHELLTGRRPFGPGEQDGEFPPGVSPEERVRLRRVLASALHEDPAQRFATAGSFLDALRGGADETLPLFLASADAAANEPSLAEPPAEPPSDTPPAAAPAGEAAESPESPMPGEVLATDSLADATLLGDARPSASEPAAESPIAWIAHRLDSDEPQSRVPALVGAPVAAPPGTTYPWAAIIAVGLAGLVLGGAIGFQVGLRESNPSPAVPPSAPAEASVDRAIPNPDPEPPADVTGPEEPPLAVRQDAPAAGPPPVTQPAPAPATRDGRLDVRSFPPDALVTLNGRVHGRTPLTIRDLEFGTYAVQVARPGYVPRSQRVTLSSARPANTITVQLEEGALSAADLVRTGSVFIASDPRGAQVYLDGALIGTTPLQVPGLRVGAHRIRLVLEGYQPLELPASVSAGRVARVDGRLRVQAAVPGETPGRGGGR